MLSPYAGYRGQGRSFVVELGSIFQIMFCSQGELYLHIFNVNASENSIFRMQLQGINNFKTKYRRKAAIMASIHTLIADEVIKQLAHIYI